MDLLIAVPAAMGLGALHSLEPGHGKGVMSAYLVSSRAGIRDAILIGFTSALSHTFSILVLALVSNTTLHYLLPSHLESWIGLISGGIITWIGIRMILQQVRPPVVSVGSIGHHPPSRLAVCSHGHDHHTHGAIPQERGASQLSGKGRLLALGAFTGFIPCPSALAILLASFTSQQIYLGLGLVLAFSLGSAIALSTLGILILKASHSVNRMDSNPFIRTLSILSTSIITGLGCFILLQALIHLGFLR